MSGKAKVKGDALGGDPRELKCRVLKVVAFDEVTLDLLVAEVNDWLESRGEEGYVAFDWVHDHPSFHGVLVYIEE